MKNKLRIAALIALFVILAAFAAFLFYQLENMRGEEGGNTPTAAAPENQPLPSPPLPVPPEAAASSDAIPADWLTYADSQVGFEMHYPKPETDELVPLEPHDIVLPSAVGQKERYLRIELAPPMDFSKIPDSNGCLSLSYGNAPATKANVRGNDFCRTVWDDGAAGSTYRTYNYLTQRGDGWVSVSFIIRFPTSVRVYAGCENDADQSKQFCIEHAFDERRDASLFDDIMATFRFTN